jgi:hypothetical protein
MQNLNMRTKNTTVIQINTSITLSIHLNRIPKHREKKNYIATTKAVILTAI